MSSSIRKLISTLTNVAIFIVGYDMINGLTSGETLPIYLGGVCIGVTMVCVSMTITGAD